MKKTIVIAILGMITLPLQGICFFQLLKAPNGKLVLIMGDWHSERHAHLMKSFCAELAKRPLVKPLQILLELSAECDPHRGSLAPNVAQLLSLEKTDKAPIAIARIEPRGNMSDHVHRVYEALTELADNVIPDEIKKPANMLIPFVREGREYTPLKWANEKKKYATKKRPVGKKGEFNCTNYVSYLQKNLMMMEAIYNKLPSEELKKLFEENCLEPYKASLKIITTELKPYSDASLFEACLDLCMACDTELELFEYFTGWYKRYIEATDLCFFNGVAFEKVVALCNDTEPLCVYLGQDHAAKVATMLASLAGWESVKEGTILLDINILITVFIQTPAFEEDMLFATRKILKYAPACAVCKATRNLKVCTQCRDIRYCGATCQRKDWPEHKKVGKKNN